MKFKRIVSILITALIVVTASAENNYKVTSSSRLNVRKAPSTTGAVLGTLKSGQEITVLSISNGWAKVEYNNSVGYVSAKYISELPKKVIEQPQEVEEIIDIIEEEPVDETPIHVSSEYHNEEIYTPLTIGTSLSEKLNIYLAVQGGMGYSSFLWENGDVNGDLSFSGDIAAQLYFEEESSFIPQNWYSELAIGYDKRGAAKFGMNYIHARAYPIGYRFALSGSTTPLNIVMKGGICCAFPLNDLETDFYSWTSDIQCGACVGVQVEWKQFALGCNFEYDFTEVSSSCRQTLHNIAILGTISYKFAKIGHKK